MKCKHVNNELIFYLDQDLDKKKMQAIEKHLVTCAHCQNSLHILKESFEIIENEKIKETNVFFYSRLAEKINQIYQPKEKYYWLKNKHIYFQALAASIIIILSIYSGIFLGTTQNEVNMVYNEELNIDNYELFADSYNLSQNTESTYDINLLETEE